MRRSVRWVPGIAFFAILAVLSGPLVTPRAAAAAVAAAPVRDPAADRADLVKLWQVSGPLVRASAEQALLGDNNTVEAFVTTGWQDVQRLDDRGSVERLIVQGGPTEGAAAQAALDSTDPAAVGAFLQDGWVVPQETDLRMRVNQMLATGGPTVKAAAQAALDAGTVDALRDFVAWQWQAPWTTDQRVKVVQVISSGGPAVKTAGQAALDAGTVDAYTDFIGSGWALATARDQEKATIADLTGSAIAASDEAVRQSGEAKEAGAKAAAAAKAAKAAAATAADLAASAHGNAELAAAAAKQAAEAAMHAATAASEAIGAANAASAAARSAAGAASRAANAATRAATAASDAYKAASATEAKAGDAKTASTAAKTARDTAKDARTTAKAAVDAANAANVAAGQAVTASNGAAVDAQSAADSADKAASASGDASAEAKKAHAAAARARADANRAKSAAAASARFAAASATAANASAAAANKAANDAEAAATAAEAAAANAATAAKDAALAKKHADLSTAAANDAVTAVQAAKDVYDAARQADKDRVALAGDQADQAAVAADQALDLVNAEVDADAEEASKRTAQTNALIAEVNAPGTSDATAVADARQIAVALSDSDGPWTKESAIAALGESDDLAVDFVRTQIPLAAAQDNRIKLTALADPDMGTGTATMKAAAATALAGSDADVAAFLRTGDYPGRQTDLRISVNQVLAAARTDGDDITATRAQTALDDGSTTTMAAFLSTGEDAAAATDDRIKVVRILSAAPADSKLKVYAQAALDGPPGLLHEFLVLDQYSAAQYDQQAAAHDNEMLAMISHAEQVVAIGVQRANEAQQIAAVAKGDAKAADAAKAAAAQSAADAATDAQHAKDSAAAAQKSADQAAASAKTAKDAATRAEASAHDAERSAAWADQSARKAAASAAAAQADAKRAHDASIAAKNDAKEAVDAAHDAVTAAKAKAKAEEDAARAKMREQCQAYLKDGVPNGKDSYNKCLDLAAMNTQQRQDLAAKNAASCQTLFPNHSSDGFTKCLQNTLDPAFDNDEAAVVKQMHDATRNKWLAIGIGVVVGVFAVACILAEPCGAFLAVAAEVLTPIIAPEFVGVTAAIGGDFLIAGGAAVVETRVAATIEADAVVSEAGSTRAEQSVIKGIEDLDSSAAKCLRNSFTPDTRVLMNNRSTKPISAIQLGDRVYTEATAPGDGVVTQLHRHTDTDLTDVEVTGGGTLHTTAHHPFWDVTTSGWTDASALHPGDTLSTPHGGTAQVGTVREYAGSQDMRNLTIAGTHTYYVLAGTVPVLVHNTGGLDGCSDAAYQGTLHIQEELEKEIKAGKPRNHDLGMSEDQLADYLDEFAGRSDGAPLKDGAKGWWDNGVTIIQRSEYSMTAFKESAADFAKRKA